MKDISLELPCRDLSCQYYNSLMELNCSYSEDNSGCIKSKDSILHDAVLGEVPKCEMERYMFGKILFQRLYFTMQWYAICDGIIIDHDQYRHDLEERLRHLA